MKFFWVKRTARANKYIFIICSALLLFSCATFRPQYGTATGSADKTDTILNNNNLDHRFFLIGDAGYASQPNSQKLLSLVKNKIKGAGKNTTLLYLGDNIYPLGMPPEKKKKERAEAEASLDSQIALAKLFNGQIHFIPGNHDWYNGLKGLEEQEDYITDKLDDKDSFLPGDGCGIDHVEVNDSIVLITMDSEWFLEDWDNYPTINDDCDIKTREAMFVEFEDILNDNQDKIIILAMHHPLFTNGTHGGEFTVKKQIFPMRYKIPLPVLGSIIDLARKASGYSTQDNQSRVYRALTDRIKALIQGKDNVIVVSGHDHNLQYIEHNNIHQVISGAGSKQEGARAIYPNDFSYGGLGYAVLDVYKDGTAKVNYFALKGSDEEKMFDVTIDLKPEVIIKQYPDTFPAYVEASVYPKELTQKGKTYKWLFGEHYRSYYGTTIKAKTVAIDTLYGGLKPVKAGGGHQSKSLRLEDKNGRQYVMRGLKKSATQFLEKAAFQNQYIGDELDHTFTENFLLDFYTSSHPYGSFVADDLAESVGIYHTNPKLFYVPKQNALKEYNEVYGNELYMIEEHPSKENSDLLNFSDGSAVNIESTLEVLEDLRKDRKYRVDQKAYVRARLFDMLVGDWDRHSDQWRWTKYERNDSVIYHPIPRDRDQVFAKYGGKLLPLLMKIPALRHMRNYEAEIKSIKWLNKSGNPLDIAFTVETTEQDWLNEVTYLQSHLTDEAIDNAFNDLPKEINDGTTEEIKTKLKARRADLKKYALAYRKLLLKRVIITGTDDKERFEITRLPKGITEIKVYSLKKDKERFLFSKTYNRDQTKEIWVYGLDDDDEFVVKGKPENPILIRLLGGQNHDIYTIESGKRIMVYDFKSKKNTFNIDRKTNLILTDDYQTNSYDVKKPKYNNTMVYPSAGYNPDDGVKLGASLNYIVNNFNRRPYSQKHKVNANFYFATQGLELAYRGEFMNIASKWNFAFDARFTSPTYSINYFGFGNESPNFDDDTGMDYNRVKLQTFSVAPSLFRESRNGSFLQIQSVFEAIEVEETNNRFIKQPGIIDPKLFEHRLYGGINATYSFANYDNVSLPTLGMAFSFTGGWTASLDETKRNFPYAEGLIDFVHNITPDDRLVFHTKLKSRLLFNNNYEFYQAATIGGDNDLRGYRRERFTGKQSFYQSSDLRFTIGHRKTNIVPVTYGILGGYDYGRVWLDGENSEKWHQSVGGGIWFNSIKVITGKVSYFHGSDGGRFSFGLTFGF